MLNTENKNLLQEYFYTNKIDPHSDLEKYIRNDGELGVDVKWYYPKFHKDMINTEQAGEKIIDVFWYKANQIAIAYGYAACYPSGRSNGWAIPKVRIGNTNKIMSLTYWWDKKHELDYQIQLNIFTMFAKNIENLFELIDKEIRDIKTFDELDQLIERIYDL